MHLRVDNLIGIISRNIAKSILVFTGVLFIISPVNAQSIYEDNFDSYSIGSVPSPWEVIGTYNHLKVTTTQAVSPTKSVNFVPSSLSGNKVQGVTQDDFAQDIKFYHDDTDVYFIFGIGNSSAVQIYTTYNGSATTSEWHTLSIVCDTEGDTTVYLDYVAQGAASGDANCGTEYDYIWLYVNNGSYDDYIFFDDLDESVIAPNVEYFGYQNDYFNISYPEGVNEFQYILRASDDWYTQIDYETEKDPSYYHFEVIEYSPESNYPSGTIIHSENLTDFLQSGQEGFQAGSFIIDNITASSTVPIGYDFKLEQYDTPYSTSTLVNSFTKYIQINGTEDTSYPLPSENPQIVNDVNTITGANLYEVIQSKAPFSYFFEVRDIINLITTTSSTFPELIIDTGTSTPIEIEFTVLSSQTLKEYTDSNTRSTLRFLAEYSMYLAVGFYAFYRIRSFFNKA